MTDTLTFDNLIAGSSDIITAAAAILSGTLTRGALLGRVLRVLGTPTFTGTGNGVMSAVSMGSKTKVGNYIVTCITAATDGGSFSVVDPDGVRLKDAVVGTAYASNHINFSIADGSTDFTVGAKFTIPITAGSLKCKLADSSAVDGSGTGYALLAADCDASGGEKTAPIYLGGEFNELAVTFGGADTADTHRDGLRDIGIVLKKNIAA